MEFFIHKEFIGLNDYTEKNRTHKYAGSTAKKRETNDVAMMLMHKPKVEQYPIKIEFIWLINNRAKDLDNVTFAKKYILDGMVKARILKSDNLTKIIAFEDKAIIVKKKHHQGVLVRITENYEVKEQEHYAKKMEEFGRL
jgi:hypothetical protein